MAFATGSHIKDAMQKLNAPLAEVARILPFVKKATTPPLVPAERGGASIHELLRPRIVTGSVRLPALAPAAALGHDARNALTSLRLLASLLGEPGVLNVPYTQAGHDLQQVASLLERLVGQLIPPQAEWSAPALGTSVSGQGSRRNHPKATRARGLQEMLENCTELLRTAAGAHVELYVSAETGLPPIALGEDDLLRVLMNLVLNASEAMPGGGTVRITARRALSRKKPAVLLHVSDNGPGIARLALGRVFEPGFTSKRRSSNACSAGLGLAIVRDLLQSIGGAVEVASTRGRGTTFELRIPCLETSRAAQPVHRHTSVTGAEWSETLK